MAGSRLPRRLFLQGVAAVFMFAFASLYAVPGETESRVPADGTPPQPGSCDPLISPPDTPMCGAVRVRPGCMGSRAAVCVLRVAGMWAVGRRAGVLFSTVVGSDLGGRSGGSAGLDLS